MNWLDILFLLWLARDMYYTGVLNEQEAAPEAHSLLSEMSQGIKVAVPARFRMLWT
jgi:hypothetical protein